MSLSLIVRNFPAILEETASTMTSLDIPRTPAARVAAHSPLRSVVTPSQLPVAPPAPGLFSPLDGAGFYEADRILKSGQVQKRKKRTKVSKDAKPQHMHAKLYLGVAYCASGLETDYIISLQRRRRNTTQTPD